jgi:hypothetical protein
MMVLFASRIAAEGSVVLTSGVVGGVELCPFLSNLILTHECMKRVNDSFDASMKIKETKSPI